MNKVTPIAEWEQEILDRQADDVIRQDERERIAALLERDAETIGGFVADGRSAVALVAFLVRNTMGQGTP